MSRMITYLLEPGLDFPILHLTALPLSNCTPHPSSKNPYILISD